MDGIMQIVFANQPTLLESGLQLMSGPKDSHPLEATCSRDEAQSSPRSPEMWKHLEAKYLKYISLLKSKADKARKNTLAETALNKLQTVFRCSRQRLLMESLLEIRSRQNTPQSKALPGNSNKTVSFLHLLEEVGIDKLRKVEYILNQHRQDAFSEMKITAKAVSQSLSKETVTTSSKISPPEPSHISPSGPIPTKVSRITDHLRSLQSRISTIEDYTDCDHELIKVKTNNSRLSQQLALYEQEIAKLQKELEMTRQRMEVELLKKSCALVESEVDAQEKEELIKEYQTRLEFRNKGSSKVLMFSLEDFEVERRRMEAVHERLFKEFESSRETFVKEVRNQSILIRELKGIIAKSNSALHEQNTQLEALRAYKFQTEYEMECDKLKNQRRFHSSPRLEFQPRHDNHLGLLNYINSLLHDKHTDTHPDLGLSSPEHSTLKAIEASIDHLLHKPNTNTNTVKNKNVILRVASFQRSIALEENVRVSTDDLHSFLEVFEACPSPSIDSGPSMEHLQSKVLSLKERLFVIRSQVLRLLQSIQIKNPTKELMELMESISETFEFSETEKESFSGGKKSLFQRMFS